MGLHYAGGGTSLTALNNAFAASLTATAVKTSAYAAAAGDLVPVDATSGAMTVTLPTAPADRTRVAVKKIDASTNVVTVSCGGSDVFNKAGGSTSLTLTLTNQAVSLQYSGGIWFVVGDDLPLGQLDTRFAVKSTEATVAALATQVGYNLIGTAFAAQATNPVCIMHRCSCSVFPEETIEAALGSASLGIPSTVLDVDANVLADGAVALMHDDTVDRTTTATGNVTAFNTQAWMNLASDAGTWFAPAWSNTLHTPLVGEFFDRFGGHVPISIEAKTIAACQPVVDEIVKRNLQKSVLMNSNILTNIATIKAAGIHACYYFSSTAAAADAPTRAAVLAAAPDSIVVQTGTASSDLATIIGWGKPVLAGETDRRWEWDQFRAAGCAGLVANDPVYTMRKATVRTTDSWVDKTWPHGLLSSFGIRESRNSALSFQGTKAIRLAPATSIASAQNSFLVGQVSPTAGAAKVVDVFLTAVTLPTDMTRYVQMTFTDNDQRNSYSSNVAQNGYAINFRMNGNIEIYRLDSAVAATNLTTKSTGVTAWTAGARRQIRVTFTATQITATDVTTGYSTSTVTDATYRPAGWYVHLGRADTANTGIGVWDLDTLNVA